MLSLVSYLFRLTKFPNHVYVVTIGWLAGGLFRLITIFLIHSYIVPIGWLLFRLHTIFPNHVYVVPRYWFGGRTVKATCHISQPRRDFRLLDLLLLFLLLLTTA